MSYTHSDKAIDTAKNIMSHINNRNELRIEFSFEQKLDTMWAACALGLESSPIVKDFYQEINLMNFNRTDNDLTYTQF